MAVMTTKRLLFLGGGGEGVGKRLAVGVLWVQVDTTKRFIRPGRSDFSLNHGSSQNTLNTVQNDLHQTVLGNSIAEKP